MLFHWFFVIMLTFFINKLCWFKKEKSYGFILGFQVGLQASQRSYLNDRCIMDMSTPTNTAQFFFFFQHLKVAVASLLLAHYFLWMMTPEFQCASFHGVNTDCFRILVVELEF